MRRYLQITTLVLLFSLIGVDASAQLVLRPEVGARPQGMGGAFTAAATDAHAPFYNPAGLAFVEDGEAALMHWRLPQVEQVRINYATISYPAGPGAAGFSWTRQSAELEEGPNASTSTLSENSLLLGYGYALTSRAAVGANLSRFTIDSKRGGGAGLGLDFGALFRVATTPVQWTLGANVKNVAANLDDESLNAIYNVGSSIVYEIQDNYGDLMWNVDLQSKRDLNRVEGYAFQFRSGIEYRKSYKKNHFALRGGVTGGTRYGLTVGDFQFDTHGDGGMYLRSFSAGAGYGWDMFGVNYTYVILQNTSVGNSHRFGLKFFF